MIVLDASAAVELLLQTAAGERLADRLLGGRELTAVPHLVDVEVAHVLRRYTAAGEVAEERARQAVEDLADQPWQRFPHGSFLPRVWELRSNLSAYDAVYVALAETLGVTLVTADRRLARAPGPRCTIESIV